MEFPPETYDVFEADQFACAPDWRRCHGGDAPDVAQRQVPRPLRIALDGTVRETQVVATSVFRAPVLAKYRLTYQAWPRNRRYGGIILVFTDDKGDAVPLEEIKSVFASIKEMSMKSASTRYDVVAGPDGRMWLKHQAWDSGGLDVQADLRRVSALHP
jgi:hypothetical protein